MFKSQKGKILQVIEQIADKMKMISDSSMQQSEIAEEFKVE
ncbi:MAG: hypothetical protein N4A62_09270 [Marinisporobacter sp.]|jgi:hypothetical protein|nr:hypothetical protein [Marinisporobacter sp.]